MVDKKVTKTPKRTGAPRGRKPALKKHEEVKPVTVEKAAEVKAETGSHRGKYFYAVGRRKTSTAKIKLYSGSGNINVNSKPVKDYFAWQPWQKNVWQPLVVVGAEKDYDVVAVVRGGGLHGQAGAVAHGIARALILADVARKKVLKTNGLLTRDPRMKERKKPGLKRARRAPQWSKR